MENPEKEKECGLCIGLDLIELAICCCSLSFVVYKFTPYSSSCCFLNCFFFIAHYPEKKHL